ncbi:cadherin repeat domain-containing protein, partial [Alphaproteobacteria bacterium]|nr:cadherin repeat domain-containing protein [Alphaproteobacteria bacterium]
MSLSTKVSLFGTTSISTFGSLSSGGSGYGGTLLGGSSGSSLFSGYGYGTGLLGSTSGLFGYGTGGTTTPVAPGSGASNNAPSFSSGTTATFAENGTGTVYTATATDADGDTLSYSIAGGADAARFSINSTSGALSFNSSPDFEAPNDSDANNAYVVNLQASDGQGGSDTQTVTVSVTDAVDAAASLVLTTDIDSFSPTATASSDQTTDFDDSVSGTVGGVNATLQTTDFIDGSLGDDSAAFNLEGHFTGFSGAGGMSGVEVVTLSNSNSFDRDFDATGVVGVTSWVLNGTDGSISLEDLADTSASVSVNDLPSGDFALDWADVSGSETITLLFDDIGTSTASTVQVDITGIEGVSIDVSGDNFINMNATATTAMTVTGSGDLDMTQSSTTLETFDASGLNGDLTADLSTIVASNTLDSVKSGSGDDAVIVDAGGLQSAATINLGGGSSDSIELRGTAVLRPNMSGVEDVILAPTGAGLTFDGDDTTGVNRFIIAESPAGDVTLVDTGANNTLVLTGDGTAQTIESQASGTLALQVSLEDGESSGTNDLTVNSFATASLQLTIDSGMAYSGTISADSVLDTVQVAVSGTAKSATISATA